MALKQTLVDDITGEEDATTREFSVDGDFYEIDLVDSTHADLMKALAGFIESARKVGKGRKSTVKASIKPAGGAAPSSASSTEQNKAIRQWAKKSGMKVNDRGRIPEDVVDAFEAAHKSADMFSAV
ncbi:histone protein [Mycobacterium phage WXIN]|nr:histone protein [Mycobacterium phage WXIN]